jgi:hypothetical protein
MRDAVLDAGRQGTPTLERNLYWLQTMAQGAPLLGLLGTVIGMIKMFAATSLAGLGDPRILSQGISEAMFATAEGLCIGIPALFAYNYLAARSDRYILEIESLRQPSRDAVAAATPGACEVSRMVFHERKRKGVDLNLNVTSLIDVLFLLLIFFMLTRRSSAPASSISICPSPPPPTPRAPARAHAETNADLVLTAKGHVDARRQVGDVRDAAGGSEHPAPAAPKRADHDRGRGKRAARPGGAAARCGANGRLHGRGAWDSDDEARGSKAGPVTEGVPVSAGKLDSSSSTYGRLDRSNEEFGFHTQFAWAF